jgi:heme-degrading monooxygenase HmoA
LTIPHCEKYNELRFQIPSEENSIFQKEASVFCAVARSLVSPENVDKFARIFNEQSIPLQERMPGFRGTYVFTKPSGELMVLTIWDSEEQANAWLTSPEHMGLSEQIGPLTNFTPPEVDRYDVPAYSTK